MTKRQRKIWPLRSFTLVEILIVTAILGIVSGTTYVSAAPQFQRARDARRKADLLRISKGIEEYYQDKGCYPVAIPVCGNPLKIDDLNVLANIPCDPKPKSSYVYVNEGGACSKWYQLYADLEFTADTIIDRVDCRRNGCGPDCKFNYGVASTNKNLNNYCVAEGSTPPPLPTPTPTPTGQGGLPTPTFTPTPSPTSPTEEPGVPTPTAAPPPAPLQYVCAPPSGVCLPFFDPKRSGCPDVYPDDPTCQNVCWDKKNQCHDERGKYH